MLSRLGPGGVGFHDQIFHQGCILPCNVREDENGNTIFEALLPAGTSFSPGAHMNHHTTISILWGSGKIVIGEQTYQYTKGSTFSIPAGTNHGFVDVEEETAFEKQVLFAQVGAA